MSEEQVAGKRRRRSRTEISELAARHLSSGLSRQEFCGQHGLGLRTSGWGPARIRRSEGSTAARNRWVAVEISSPPSPAATSAANSLAVLVVRHRIEVPQGFDREALRQLVPVLEAP